MPSLCVALRFDAACSSAVHRAFGRLLWRHLLRKGRARLRSRRSSCSPAAGSRRGGVSGSWRAHGAHVGRRPFTSPPPLRPPPHCHDRRRGHGRSHHPSQSRAASLSPPPHPTATAAPAAPRHQERCRTAGAAAYATPVAASATVIAARAATRDAAAVAIAAAAIAMATVAQCTAAAHSIAARHPGTQQRPLSPGIRCCRLVIFRVGLTPLYA